MRRVLSVSCCALYLAFGLVAGLAHQHASADHHAALQGLHLDHDHLGESRHREHHHDHHPGSGDPDAVDRLASPAARYVDHHDGDAVSLSATAARSVDPSVRPVPAIVSPGVVIDPPPAASDRAAILAGQPRDPPREDPPRPRAPPA
jgi:hypothetical protein